MIHFELFGVLLAKELVIWSLSQTKKRGFMLWSWGWELNPYITALQAVA